MKVIIITIIIVKIAEALRLGNFLLILTYIARNKNEAETLNFVSDHGSGSITFIFLWLRLYDAELISVNDNRKCT